MPRSRRRGIVTLTLSLLIPALALIACIVVWVRR
jgi:hypothetical protein